MFTFYDSKGESYNLTHRSGGGGEGTVYACPNDSGMVAKIYHEPISEVKAEKLRWMAANKNDRLLKVAAWITDTLRDAPGGRIVGFLMPNVKAKEIHELYSLKSRRVHFPRATWQFLVHTAANVARAFYGLHKNNHIMGDVNHGNCVVLADGTVKLIDCDSYSIGVGDTRYPCEVGVLTHLAPELQGKNLSGVERLPAHDNFGLAVIIFQLLFLGRHPFAGNYTGGEDKSLEDCIRELRFAYGKDAHLWQVKQPPGTLSLDAVSPRVALMLERAFLTEDRPEPREWVEALEDLSQNLKQCGLHPGHHYFQELHDCPWCAIEAQTGLMLFPFVSGNNANGEEIFNIFTVENLIASFGVSPNLPALPAKPAKPLPPAPEIEYERKNYRQQLAMLAVVQFVAVCFLTALFDAGAAFYIGFMVMIILISIYNQSHKIFKDGLRDQVRFAKQDLEKLEIELTRTNPSAQFEKNLVSIKQKVNDYQNIQLQSRQKLKTLRDGVQEDKLNLYLSSFKLANAEISGIERKHLASLKLLGITSAADVQANRLRSMEAIDYATGSKLLEWRKNLEENFEFKADDGELPEAEQKHFAGEFSEKRRKVEREIEQLLGNLRSGAMTIRQRQQQMVAEFENAARELWQAESNLTIIGSIIPAIFVLIFVTISSIGVVRMFQPPSPLPPAISSKSKTDSFQASNSSSGRGYGYGNGYGTAPLKDSYSKQYEPEFHVQDNITDDEIEEMYDVDRRAAANTLFREAQDLSRAEEDYPKAEKKLRLAVRLNSDMKILNQLGYVLYLRGKYSESLNFLYESEQINARDTGTKTFIGMNFLKMRKFEKARAVFDEVTRLSPKLFEGYFNLGLAYEGLKEYSAAVDAFRKAAAINPGDADTNYEIAVNLNKLGDRDGVYEQYQILLNKDTETAEKLRRAIKIKPVKNEMQVVEMDEAN